MRWQQFTGPIMAKAFEDTFLYVFNPLVSLNEVGGDPRPSTAPAADFHGLIESDRTTGRTHERVHDTDTKRGEDVRARINVLSEIPEEWQALLDRWSKPMPDVVMSIDGQSIPDRNEEIFFIRRLLGAWPLRAPASDSMGAIKGIRDQSDSRGDGSYALDASKPSVMSRPWTGSSRQS